MLRPQDYQRLAFGEVERAMKAVGPYATGA